MPEGKTVRITITVPDGFLAHVQEMARQESIKELTRKRGVVSLSRMFVLLAKLGAENWKKGDLLR